MVSIVCTSIAPYYVMVLYPHSFVNFLVVCICSYVYVCMCLLVLTSVVALCANVQMKFDYIIVIHDTFSKLASKLFLFTLIGMDQVPISHTIAAGVYKHWHGNIVFSNLV